MQDIFRNLPKDSQSAKAWLFSILLVSYVSITMFLGNQGEVDDSVILSADPIFLLILQGIFSIFMFIIVSLLFAKFILKLPASDFFPKMSWSLIGLTAVIALSFMIVNSAVGEWNMNIDFPDSSFEEWAKQSEEQLKKLTEHVVNFTSFTHFIIAIIVVAIIPAIGEELLFRGLIQNLFVKAFSNYHVAIWISGLAFAAIHMQFYGLAPRMLLGVVFGYLYHWSGKLSVAMLAHFVNNGFALFMLYLGSIGTIEMTPEQMESSAPWPMVLIFGLVCVLLLRVFYKKYQVADE